MRPAIYRKPTESRRDGTDRCRDGGLPRYTVRVGAGYVFPGSYRAAVRREAGVCGLLHYMLPDSAIHPAAWQGESSMFADTGSHCCSGRQCAAGANKRNLLAHAASGPRSSIPSGFDIGKRNCLARKILRKAGVC